MMGVEKAAEEKAGTGGTEAWKLFGMEWYVFGFFAVVIGAAVYFGALPDQITAAIAVLFCLAIFLGELGERIPIWNKYMGGGAVLAFLVCGLLTYFNLIPESVRLLSDGWMQGYNFMNYFIACLVVGSLLGLERNTLLKSCVLYMPVIVCGLVASMLFGVLAGHIFGVNPIESLVMYVLPVMGGGVGAGAVPMSQVYAEVTGKDVGGFLSFATAIIAIANIISIIGAIGMNMLGEIVPALTGNGELVRRKGVHATVEKEEKVRLTPDDIGAGIFLIAGFWALSELMAKVILPEIAGVAIPDVAWMIILAIVANAFNLVPSNLKAGVQACQHFFADKLVWVQMVGCGITLIDFNQMIAAFSISSVVIALFVVGGCALGCAVMGWIVGFYPIESGITAGLCMANMGGAGDLAVMGACKRMNLICYTQIANRLGGAAMLLVSSFIFQLV